MGFSMYLDAHGFPTESNGDANDQLCSCGLISAGLALGGDIEAIPLDCFANTALIFALQPRQGVYIRHVNGDPSDVSADQLIPVMAAWAARRDEGQLFRMILRMIERLGFAQNWKRLDGSRKFSPDFMLIRALPIALRTHWIFYPLCLIFDVLLPLQAIFGNFITKDDSIIPRYRGLDDVDTRVFIVTMIVARKLYPTPFSLITPWLYRVLCPRNFGVTLLGSKNNVQGQLDWYHRNTFRRPGEAAGNIEIARLFEPLVEEVFY